MSAISAEKEAFLDFEKAKRLFRYDSETGDVIRLTGKLRGLPVRRKMGRYLGIKLEKRMYVAHRVIWLLVHGEWPVHQIDHKDGNGMNNVLSNLRVATPQQNMMNMRICKRNSTGIKGVFMVRGAKKFSAAIHHNYGRKHLGTFDTKEQAGEAYEKAAIELFGEFARTK